MLRGPVSPQVANPSPHEAVYGRGPSGIPACAGGGYVLGPTPRPPRRRVGLSVSAGRQELGLSDEPDHVQAPLVPPGRSDERYYLMHFPVR